MHSRWPQALVAFEVSVFLYLFWFPNRSGTKSTLGSWVSDHPISSTLVLVLLRNSWKPPTWLTYVWCDASIFHFCWLLVGLILALSQSNSSLSPHSFLCPLYFICQQKLSKSFFPNLTIVYLDLCFYCRDGFAERSPILNIWCSSTPLLVAHTMIYPSIQWWVVTELTLIWFCLVIFIFIFFICSVLFCSVCFVSFWLVCFLFFSFIMFCLFCSVMFSSILFCLSCFLFWFSLVWFVFVLFCSVLFCFLLIGLFSVL